MRHLFLLGALFVFACTPLPRSTSTSPNWRRTTSFVPAPSVTGSRLATDRVVRIQDPSALDMVGAVKLGVLTVRVAAGLRTTTALCFGEEALWPGASVDAAALGATHARVLTTHATAPAEGGGICPTYRPGKRHVDVTETVTSTYELWHVSEDDWAYLPSDLRPSPLPASAIRDVEPGNWVRPPTVVEIKSR